MRVAQGQQVLYGGGKMFDHYERSTYTVGPILTLLTREAIKFANILTCLNGTSRSFQFRPEKQGYLEILFDAQHYTCGRW